MKKFFVLTFILAGLVSTTTFAQPAATTPSVLQQMKDQQKPGLIDKVGLSDAQAERVLEIFYETRMQAGRELKDLNEADRSKKLAELKASKEKQISEVLTPAQITAMNKYYEDMSKNMPRKN